MARSVRQVWFLSCEMVAQTAFSVGGLGASAAADLTLARDGAGHFYVPGTSLAGILRERLRRVSGVSTSDNEALFGCAPVGSDAADVGNASHAYVYDAPMDSNVASELRDGVGIDREFGAAADGIFYARQVLPSGTKLALRMRVEVPDSLSQTAAESLPRLAASIRDRGLSVGAATSRGLGRFQCNDVRLSKLDLSDPIHQRTWWTYRAKRLHALPTDFDVDLIDTSPEDLWTFEIAWRPRGPLMVSGGAEAIDADRVPVQSKHGAGWRAVLPGSSIKGALRAHAERIVRTVASLELPDLGPTDKQRFLEQVKVPWVDDLFGRASKRDQKEPARGAISIEDCHHKHTTSEHVVNWSEIESTNEENPWPGYVRRTRTAIDRWTGAAMDTALFTLLDPPWHAEDGSPWGPIRIEVDLARHVSTPEAPQRPQTVMALLFFVLRDLAEGLVPLGFGTQRGMGDIAVEAISVTHEGESLPALHVENGQLVPPTDPRWTTYLNEWSAAWTHVHQPV